VIVTTAVRGGKETTDTAGGVMGVGMKLKTGTAQILATAGSDKTATSAARAVPLAGVIVARRRSTVPGARDRWSGLALRCPLLVQPRCKRL